MQVIEEDNKESQETADAWILSTKTAGVNQWVSRLLERKMDLCCSAAGDFFRSNLEKDFRKCRYFLWQIVDKMNERGKIKTLFDQIVSTLLDQMI